MRSPEPHPARGTRARSARRLVGGGIVWILVALLGLTACDGSPLATPPAATPAPTIAAPTTRGPCPDPGFGASPFRTASRGCVPAGRLVLLRCPGSEALLVRGSGTGRARGFLGGTFAVQVPHLPPEARAMGAASRLEVFRVPGDPRILYVKRDGDLRRWLRLPARPVPAPRPTASVPSGSPAPSGSISPSSTGAAHAAGTAPSVTVIGDSIARGADPWLRSSLPGWVVTVDAEIGRASVSGVSIAASLAATIPPPDVVVVELGTNDADPAAFRANADAILSSLQDVGLVIWQTTHGPMTHVPAVNAQIRRAVRSRPNAALADWDAFVPPEDLTSDGVHPLGDHEDDMAKLLAPMLQAWISIASDPTPGACPSPPGILAP